MKLRHAIVQKRPCDVLKFLKHKKMDLPWSWLEAEKREAIIKKKSERKSERKQRRNWLLSSFVFFCVSCYIIDEDKMWTDYTVSQCYLPLNDFNSCFRLLFMLPIFCDAILLRHRPPTHCAPSSLSSGFSLNCVCDNPALWIYFYFALSFGIFHTK